jgi:hypothetical protein
MTMTDPISRPRRRVGREVEVTECACAPDGQLCLFHYAGLNPGRQAAARRQAGIRELYVEARRYRA